VLTPEHQLGVVHQVEGENQGSGGSESDHGPLVLFDEDHGNSGDKKDDEESQEDATTSREVNLGLEREEGEGQGDGTSDPDSDDDRFRVISGGQAAKNDTLASREDSEEDEVMWSLSSDIGAAGESDDADYRDGPTGVENPHIIADIALDTLTEHEDGDDARSDGQLDHQDPVHSADEVPPDGFISKSSPEAGILLILLESTLDVIMIDCALLLRDDLGVLLRGISLL